MAETHDDQNDNTPEQNGPTQSGAPPPNSINMKLISAARDQKDATAIKTIGERSHHKLYRICFDILGNKSDADEAVQIAWERIFEKLPSSSAVSPGQFWRWMATITVNVCKSYLRAAKRSKTESIDGLETRGIQFPSNPTAYSETSLKGLETSIALLQALDRLDPIEQTIIDMYYVDGKTLAEIAQEFNTSHTTIHNWLKRAYATLRRELEGGEGQSHGK